MVKVVVVVGGFCTVAMHGWEDFPDRDVNSMHLMFQVLIM